jgi:hypothetical protein
MRAGRKSSEYRLGWLRDRWETMSVDRFDPSNHVEFRLTENVSWWDPDAECTLILTDPRIDPNLWTDYLMGAERRYREHGVERALDLPAIRDGRDTTMFWATLDVAGNVVGGVRTKGPLRGADESHSVIEWAGRPGLAAVRQMINDRVAFGVLEMKSAWVTGDPERTARLTRVLARTGFQALALLDAQFGMATSAPHVLTHWRSSGGLVASIPSTPYPDARYQTKMMWWDRNTFADHADPEQVTKIRAETANVVRVCRQVTTAPVRVM